MAINNLKYNDDELYFDIENVDVSFANAIRRCILSDCETIGFNVDEYLNSDLKILNNSSSLHNEFILHRVGLIPINIENIRDFYNSKYKFILHKENNTDSMINVTTEDFKVINTETNKEEETIKFFPPNPHSGEYILILKLKSNPNGDGEKIHIEGHASKSSGSKNARYCPASCVYYRNMIDNAKLEVGYENYLKEANINKSEISEAELKKIRNRFEIEESERFYFTDENDEPNKYNFYIESIGVLKPYIILKDAINIIINKLMVFKSNASKIINENAILDEMEIYDSLERMNATTIVVNNESHTLGNLLQAYISKLNSDTVKFVGYKNPHPLKKNIEIKILTENNDKQTVYNILENTCDSLITILNSIKETVVSTFNIDAKKKIIKKRKSPKKELS